MTLHKIHSALLFAALCCINVSALAGGTPTASHFFSFNAGVSSSFISGATGDQHVQFLQHYASELQGKKFDITSSLLPATTPSFGIKYGIPFNDKMMLYTGLFYTPRGFTEKFKVSSNNVAISEYRFNLASNYWDLYLGLKYKNNSGVTLTLGAMAMYNVKDIITITRTTVVNGKNVDNTTTSLVQDYYLAQRDLFPIASFVGIGFEQRYWSIDLESSYSSNLFLATEVEMNFINVNLRSTFLLLWD